MEPQLSRGISVAQDQCSERKVYQIRQDCTRQQEPDIDLRITENPSEQPEGGPKMPKKHLRHEDATAVDTAGQVDAESLLLFRR